MILLSPGKRIKVCHYQKMNGLTLRHWILLICSISVISAVKWPRGTYTLVKPKSGCPSGWLQGWRYQDNEDDSNQNRVTYGHHFFGISGSSPNYMNVSYCTKDLDDCNSEGQWPSGNYCILKHGNTCPIGAFRSGSVFWDDEDNNNINRAGGELPSGSFGRNTRINYCCRNDGSYSTRIRLPKTKPFYLLRYTSYCQRVEGMYFREETVYTDDEDDNNINSVSGSHPFGPVSGGRNHKLYYCYYWSH
ncbi:uncharacterized protein LOC125657178 isoform X1 [Ostrea edulis]|uniref:uncharacterized protein LOC125657178 isoform X1 n=2 Tax=Ostrea edulis TaxID=37623 RepID=UPI0024AF39B2|nr:uncharacterized protein LOC125657178 isoform X1 [Ostrea edulis]